MTTAQLITRKPITQNPDNDGINIDRNDLSASKSQLEMCRLRVWSVRLWFWRHHRDILRYDPGGRRLRKSIGRRSDRIRRLFGELRSRSGFCRIVGNASRRPAEVCRNGFHRSTGLGCVNDVQKIEAGGRRQKVELLDSLVLDACKVAASRLTVSLECHFVFRHLHTNRQRETESLFAT